tara:strand:- start:567 stop:707 length:141 start_codon:yes stop_codon:yes gene_type:complete
MGGIIRREKPFIDGFNEWCSSVLGIPMQVKITMIKQELDKKYNYKK